MPDNDYEQFTTLSQIKSAYGLSAHDLIQSIRLSHAKSLLKEASNAISRNCLPIELNDPEYFSRVFKKEFGVSPSKYRDG